MRKYIALAFAFACLIVGTSELRANPNSQLPPVAIPSATANWTPTDASGAALSLTVNVARTVQIGPMVWVFANITYPVTANGASMKISLPKTVYNAAGGAQIPSCTVSGAGSTDFAYFNPNTTNMNIYNDINKTTTRTNVNYSGITLTFSCWYPAA